MKWSILNGFTLIELLVVAGIAATLFVLTIPSFINFSRRQETLQAALNLKNILRDSQNRASSGEKSTTSCTGSDILQGFYASISLNGNSLLASGRCGLINFNQKTTSFSQGSSVVGFYDASSSPCSTLTVVNNKVTILFKPIAKGVSFYDGDLDFGTRLSLSKLGIKLLGTGNDSYYVIIENAGDIYEKQAC